jgi:endonuclease/exonuclease/phosphatase family metal-dependent hydrolase
MTLNLWFNPRERQARMLVAAELIRRTGTEIVCVQEIPGEDTANTIELLAEASGLKIAAISQHDNNDISNGILCVDPYRTESDIVSGESANKSQRYAAAATIRSAHGFDIHVISTHFVWGMDLEHLRLNQAQAIDAEARRRWFSPASNGASEPMLTILCGDMNTLSGHDSMRYLRGELSAPTNSTLWTDAHMTSGEGEGYTSTSDNLWACEVATRHGITPRLLPQRRIDYVYVHGYAYGRVLAPLGTYVVNEGTPFPASDHAAVICDLWDGTGEPVC